MEPHTQIQLAIGNAVTAKEFLAANKLRGWAVDYITGLFDAHNLTAIVGPTVGLAAPMLPAGPRTVGETDMARIMQMMRHIFLANLVGLPAISAPVAYDPDGLPIGLHLMANHWQDHVLLRLAGALETGHVQRRRPPVFHDLRLHDGGSAV